MTLKRHNIRAIAASVLLKNLKTDKFLQDILEEELIKFKLSLKDRQLLFHIVLGLTRNHILLETILSEFLNLKKTKDRLKIILKIAIYQIFFLNKIPDYAITSSMMQTADIFKMKRQQKNFLRAIISKFIEKKAKYDLTSEFIKNLPLAKKYSYPEWLINHLSKEIYSAKLEDVLIAGNSTPPVWISSIPQKTDHDKLKEILDNEHIDYSLDKETEIFTFKNLNTLLKEMLNNGDIMIQSPPQKHAISQCPAVSGDVILEIGAAPGGKTIYLSKLAGNNGKIFSLDNNLNRIKLLKERIRKVNLKNVVPLLHDILTEKSDLMPETFDHIVLDTPCSNLSELCRRPEVRWNIKENDIVKLSNKQQSLTSAAINLLKNKGTLLYITCTISTKENQDIKEYIINKHNLKLLKEELILPSKNIPTGSYFALFEKSI